MLKTFDMFFRTFKKHFWILFNSETVTIIFTAVFNGFLSLYWHLKWNTIQNRGSGLIPEKQIHFQVSLNTGNKMSKTRYFKMYLKFGSMRKDTTTLNPMGFQPATSSPPAVCGSRIRSTANETTVSLNHFPLGCSMATVRFVQHDRRLCQK